MASKLKAVAPKATEPSKPKILIYGKPGVGKTWASLDFPGVYYIDTEGGADLSHYTDKLAKAGGVYLGPEQDSLDFDIVLEQVRALATEQHNFKTLVIDSISKLFNTAIAEEAERLGDKDAFGASKKPAIACMRRLIAWLTRLNMNVILIAHEKAEWGQNAKGERVEIGATFDCWDKLEYELHLALNITKQGSSRYAFVRKSRLEEFPDASRFPWSYADFAEKYGRAVIEKPAHAITLASPEQLTEIERLLKIVKLDDSAKDKWITNNLEALADVETEKAEGIITHLKGKLA